MNREKTRNIKMSIRNARGVALLPLVFVFAGLVVTVALAFSTISISQSIAVESEFGAARALHYAEAGQNDALMRLSRDKNYRCDTGDCYQIPFATDGCTQGIACVSVLIEDGVGINEVKITTRGMSNANTRIIERITTLDNVTNGAHTDTSWCERSNAECL